MKSGNKKAFTSHFVLKTGMMRYSIHINSQSAIHHPKFRIIHCKGTAVTCSKRPVVWIINLNFIFYSVYGLLLSTNNYLKIYYCTSTYLPWVTEVLFLRAVEGRHIFGWRPKSRAVKVRAQWPRSDSFRAGHCQVSGRNHKGPRLINMVMGIQVKVTY